MEYKNSIQELYERFLVFENSSRVLEFRYKYHNMLVWPFIRAVIWDSILKSQEGAEAGLIDNVKENLGRSKILSYKWTQFFKLNKNPLFCKEKKDVLFLYWAIENIKDSTGQYYGRIHDDFVGMYEKTAIIESATLFRHFYPKKYKTYESDFLDIVCLFNEKIARLDKTDKAMIDSFIRYLKEELDFKIDETYWKIIEIELERYAKNNCLIYQFYRRCFLNIEPKIVFVTNGCDGAQAACKFKVLQDMGIASAEMQHGLVNLSHFAYNYSEKILKNKEYREYMPDTFLTFGEFWKSLVRLPMPIEVLGSANFSRNRREEDCNAQGILVLPVDTESYLDLVRFLSQNLPGEKIIVKIHPLLKSQYDLFGKLKLSNVSIYIDGNIYDYFRLSKIVIGDSSTALYEAAALEKVVLVWNTKLSMYMDKRIGHWFEDKYELLRLLKGHLKEEYRGTAKGKDIFDPDIETNYMRFIKKYI